MKKIFTILLIVIMTFSLTACQPTPEQGFVQPKNEDELSNLINQTNQPDSNALQNSDIPDNVTDIVQSNDLTVDVDAKVTVPQTNAYPVVYAEPLELTQEQADLILNELIGDAPLVSLREQDATALMSKEQIIDRIGELKLMLQDGTKDENEIENINQQITELEK